MHFHRNRGGIKVSYLASLGTNDTAEITKVINRKRDIGCHGFPDGLTVIPGFHQRQAFKIFLYALGNFEHDITALS